jgi:hypothetical protein
VQSIAGKVSYYCDSPPEVRLMLTNKPSFPAFDEWARMSEQEQDAFLTRMENMRRRRRWLLWTVLSAGSLGALSLLVATLH